MRLTRRRLMIAGAAMLAPRLLHAATLEAGGRRIDTVSDGNLLLPKAFVFAPVAESVTQEMTAEFDLGESLEPPCNLTLLRGGDRTVLFDAGSGAEFMPSAGRLADALDALGISPDEVTDLVLTHAHPDHLWGVLDDFGDPAFPNARVLIGAAERAYWSDPATLETIGEARVPFAVGAARRLEQIGGALDTFEAGDEVAPGVTAIATPGHTPGHMSFGIEMDGETATVIGDAVANEHVAMRHPGQPIGADQDPELAIETRLALLDALAGGGPAIGFHLPGGLGRVMRQGDAYGWAPA